MATYLELRGLFTDSDLLNRVEVAVIVAANKLPDTIDNNSWVANAYNSTESEAKKALKGVLAIHNALSVDEIKGASNNALQTAVNTVVSTLVKAQAGV